MGFPPGLIHTEIEGQTGPLIEPHLEATVLQTSQQPLHRSSRMALHMLHVVLHPGQAFAIHQLLEQALAKAIGGDLGLKIGE